VAGRSVLTRNSPHQPLATSRVLSNAAHYGRIVPKAGTPGGTGGLAHVARAPLSGKMATGTWQKWYNGSWSQPGVGGLESNMVPTGTDPNGYTPVANDYHPANAGTVDQMVAANKLPPKSDLFVMNITYDAYLGLYIGEPEVVSGTGPQKFYATADLATQEWTLIGDSGAYTSGSWYRWFVDGANKTSSTIVGRTFRSYCSIACAGSDGEYADVTVASSAPAAPPVDPSKTYTIGSAQYLFELLGSSTVGSLKTSVGSPLGSWVFTPNGDGSFRIANAFSGDVLGVDSSTPASRAWATTPTLARLGRGGPTVGQQWFIIANTSPTGAKDGTFRLVNRHRPQRRLHGRGHGDHPVDVHRQQQPTLDRDAAVRRRLHRRLAEERPAADHGLHVGRRAGDAAGRHRLGTSALDHLLSTD
jgi:hypothetical protein